MSGTKQILLTGSRGAGVSVLVDEEDFDKYGQMGWYLSDTGYAVIRKIIDGKKKTLRLHRLITNCPDGLVVDHLNGNPLDCRKSNLRVCTQAENSKNHHGTKGYCYDKTKKKWVVHYRKKFYGRYKTEEEAKRAYQLAKSGQEYQKARRKYNVLPKHISKQFGKYRVGVQVNGVRYRKVTFDTLSEAISWRDNFYKTLAKED